MRSDSDRGCPVVKKIGGASLDEDLRRIDSVLFVLQDRQGLCVDANGRFDLDAAIAPALRRLPRQHESREQLRDAARDCRGSGCEGRADPYRVGCDAGALGVNACAGRSRVLRARRTRAAAKDKGLATHIANPLISLAPRPGLEPGTYGLTVRRSTD